MTLMSAAMVTTLDSTVHVAEKVAARGARQQIAGGRRQRAHRPPL